MDIKILELFAGSRSIGKVAEELGYKVFSVDVKDFEKKIGQKIHVLTKSYWHPKAEIRVASDKLWVDEDEFDREYTEFGETQEEYEPEIPSLYNK